MQKTTHKIPALLTAAALTIASLTSALAQTTANWNGAGADGNWNTDLNWDVALVPGPGTNAVINGATVTYSNAMAASNIDGLTVGTTATTLNIGAPGFNVAFNTVMNASSTININSGGVMTNGTLNEASQSSVVVNVNSGGVVTNATTQVSNNGSNDGGVFRVQNGAVASLGNVAIKRSGRGLFSNGLVIFGGTVTANQIDVGSGNSYCYMSVGGGTLNIAGKLRMGTGTASSGREANYYQTNGVVTSGGTVDMAVASTYTTFFTLTRPEAVFYTPGIQIFPNAVSSAVARITNSGTIYLGGSGLNVVNSSAGTYAIVLGNQGTLGALADWNGNPNMSLGSGTITFNAADQNGTAHNITLSGALSGAGSLNKTGAGTLTLGAVNTYSGSTFINNGVLVLDVGGSLASPSIVVGSGAVFDVSLVSGYTLASGKTLGGGGSVIGAVAAGSGSAIAPGGVSAQGTLTFSNGLSVSGANFNVELTDDPGGLTKTNDAVNIVGDLTASGLNTIIVTPVGSLAPGTYRLIKYSGNFNGDLSNFTCAAGTLTNPAGEIDLVVTSVRPTAHLIWRGDGSANLWDTATNSNWLNGVTLDRFYTGDTNIFDDSATNFTVNLSGVVSPASSSAVLVNATNNYTIAGSGNISGTTGLTKTNSGKLTILAANDYSGVTTIAGGTLSVSNLANGGVSSPIGAANNAAANILLAGGTLEYLGANATIDRGMTVQTNGGSLSVVAGTTLTLSGALTGPGTLTKIGNGQITLTGGNDLAGGIAINSGTIRANPSGTLGSGPLTLNGTTNTATFQFAGDAQTVVNTLNITGTNNFIANNGNDTISTVTGNGTVILGNGSGTTLTLQSSLSGFTGAFKVTSLPNLRFFPSGSVLDASGATIDLGSGSCLLNNKNGNLTVLIGALIGGTNTVVQGASSENNPSTYIIGGNNLSTTFSGSITEVSTSRKVNLVKAGTGTLTLDGNIKLTGSTTVSNGTLAIVGATALNTSPSVTLASLSSALDFSQKGIADNTGTNLIITGLLEVPSSQTLAGLGAIRGSLLTDSGSTLNVGLPGTTGTLTVTNTVTLNGTTKMKLNRGVSPNSDRVAGASITYGGTLIVTNIGSTLHVGDIFTLFSGSGLDAGSFGSVQLPPDYGWDTSQLGVNGTITVTSVPTPPTPPTLGNVTISGNDFTLTATGGTPNGTVSVLSSTNVALPLAQWTVVTTGNFDGSGNYSYTITGGYSAGTPQQFYILQAQ